MKFEVTVEKEGDRYDAELNAPEGTTVLDGMTLICHSIFWLAENLVKQEGMSLEEAEKKILDLARELLEENREGKEQQE